MAVIGRLRRESSSSIRRRATKQHREAGALEALIEEITVDAAGDDGNLWAFRQGLEQQIPVQCVHGYGLCCWRLGRFEEAEGTFARVLWLNPSDNQGARFLLGAVRARAAWTPDRTDAGK
jgi:hypothetical protein